MAHSNTTERLYRLYKALEEAYGPMNWWPAAGGGSAAPFEVCAGAILTQNAPWTGVVKAIRALRDLGIFSVEGILAASEKTLAEALKPTVYYNQKTRKLKAFCVFLSERFCGRIEEMGKLPLLEARSLLLEVSGIGRETADSILLYALRKPIFVVDAYTWRILVRHGLAGEDWGYEELRALFENAFAPDPEFYNEFHALLCHTGAKYCRRKPDCPACPALKILGEPIL